MCGSIPCLSATVACDSASCPFCMANPSIHLLHANSKVLLQAIHGDGMSYEKTIIISTMIYTSPMECEIGILNTHALETDHTPKSIHRYNSTCRHTFFSETQNTDGHRDTMCVQFVPRHAVNLGK